MNSDSILIWRMKKGDEKSVDEFVRKYYDRILQYFRLRISDFGQAEDLTQETFEKFFRSFGEYRHYGKAINYLYVIAGNTCKDFYKKAGRRVEMEALNTFFDTLSRSRKKQKARMPYKNKAFRLF